MPEGFVKLLGAATPNINKGFALTFRLNQPGDSYWTYQAFEFEDLVVMTRSIMGVWVVPLFDSAMQAGEGEGQVNGR